MRLLSLLAASASLLLAACGGTATSDKPTAAAGAATQPAAASTPTGWVEADLSGTAAKLPLVVKAPGGYSVAASPLGGAELTSEQLTFDVDDVTETGGAKALADQKAEVKAGQGMVFEKFVLETPDGFIAQMGAGNYLPARLVQVGGRAYLFWTIPLNAQQSEADARQVYELAAQAKAK